MTTLEIFLAALLFSASVALWLVLRRSVPSDSLQDLQLQLIKLQHELGHAQERVGVYSANMEVLRAELEDAKGKLIAADHNAAQHQQDFEKLLHQKKSSEVKVGQISEQVLPLLDGFDYSTKQMRFIGSPFDYVVFGDDMITFLEVKTGNSQMSQKQKHLRSLVESGKVQFKLVRLTEKGLKR